MLFAHYAVNCNGTNNPEQHNNFIYNIFMQCIGCQLNCLVVQPIISQETEFLNVNTEHIFLPFKLILTSTESTLQKQLSTPQIA